MSGSESGALPVPVTPESQPDLKLFVPSPDPDVSFTGERFLPGLSGEIELEHLHRYLVAAPLCAGRDVLDVACGEGYGSQILAQVARTVCGVDVDDATVCRARTRYGTPSIGFKTGSCTALPVADQSVDVVVSFETIEHITEHEQFLQEIRRVLRPDGTLLISTPDREVYNRQIPAPNPFHLRELSREEFQSLLREHFRYVGVSSQRTLFASALSVTDLDQADQPSPLLFATQDENRLITLSRRPVAGTYLIALCSNVEPLSLPNSLFEGAVKPNYFSALQGGIAERDRRIMELLYLLGQRDSEISQIQRDLTNRDEAIGRLKEHLARLDAQILEHRNLFAARDAAAARLQEHLAGRERTLREIQGQLAQREETVRQLQAQLTSRTEEVRSQQARLARQEGELHQLHEQLASTLEALNAIRGSRAWRLAHALSRTWKIARALPSLRRRGARFLGRALKRLQLLAPGTRRLARQLIRSGLFDQTFYLECNLDIARARIDPVGHYLVAGAAEGRNPHPLFDTSFYLEHNPDVAASGVNPLAHFLARGGGEGRDPHPLFDTSFYLEHNPDVAASGANPLAHFLARGAAEGLDPHPLFDTSFYLERNPDVAASGANPLAHFLSRGATEGRDPHPLFDTSFYLKHNPDVAASGTNPLTHFLVRGGGEGRDPHPLFDTSFYLERNPDVAASGINPLTHFLARGATEPPLLTGPGFDPAFYRAWNPEARPDVCPLVDFVTRFVNPPAGDPDEAELLALVEAINQAGAEQSVSAASPQVSIIIPVHNQVVYTLRCIQSLRRHASRYRFEILVIDDCSGDATSCLVPKLAGVHYLRNESNRGFLCSCNHAAEAALGEFLVFLNNDTVVLPGWLDELIDTFAHVPRAGLVGSKLIYPTGVLQEAGGIVWCDGSAWNYGRCDDRKRPEYNYVREVDYCSGASIAVRRSLWQQLGGFDEAYAPAYYEDADLALRVRQAGYQVLYQPLSALVHFEGVSCGTDLTSGVKAYQVVNAETFFRRHHEHLARHGQPGVLPHLERDRGARSRVLVIDACTLTPDQDAGSRVALDLIQAFQQAGYLVTFAPDGLEWLPRYTQDLQRLGIHCLYAPYTPTLEAHLREFGPSYDLVVIFRAPVATKTLYMVRQYAPQAKIVFHTVDLHYLREQRQAALQSDAGLAQAAVLSKARELAMVLAADCTIVVSQFEKDLLAVELPRANVHFFPYVMDVAGNRCPFEERSGILFVGGFRHLPNVDAVLYFVRSVFPLVRAQVPEARFQVVGSNVPPELRTLNEAGVELLGHVPDLAPYFGRCRVSVAPLRYGAGIKGKIVTSMSFGVPCVTTSVGAEGMGVRDGEEVLVADDPQAFAEAVVRLYTDRDLWARLSSGASTFVQRNYSREAGQRRVQDILTSIGLAPGEAAAG